MVEEKSEEVNTFIGSRMTRSDYKLTKEGIEHISEIAKELNSEMEKITKIKKEIW